MTGYGECDSILDPITSKKVIDPPGSPEDVFPLPNYLFVKTEGKWYLKNILCPGFINVGRGFDSIRAYGHAYYKVFNGARSKYYRYDYKGPFEQSEIELEYPDDPGVFRIACKKCDLQMKKILKEGTKYSYNELGDEEKIKVIDTVRIPFIKSGLLNILDSEGRFVLKDWVNEIKFPEHRDSTFSLTDSTSQSFGLQPVDTSRWPNFTTLAVKKDGKWKLLNVKNQSLAVPCEEVKFEDRKWVVKSAGITLYYSADDLKQIN
jgi:hypothetical protein